MPDKNSLFFSEKVQQWWRLAIILESEVLLGVDTSNLNFV
jgi:hypothetical protein